MGGRDPGGVSAYTTEQVAALLGLSLSQLRGYVRAGVIEPARGPAGELRFTFQDLVFLRVVKELSGARIPPRRMRQALRSLRDRLPDDRPLSGVRLSAEGRELLVREADRLWSPESGQYVFDFAEWEAGSEPVPLPAREPEGEGEPRVEVEATAEGWYVLGSELESRDPEEARKAYGRALAIDPKYADAHVNLGCLEHEAGRLAQAERHYRAALDSRPADATAAFNLGVVLEDRGRLDEARAAYELSLEADPRCADTHYNLARLHDRLGDRAAALRHLRIYRKLS